MKRFGVLGIALAVLLSTCAVGTAASASDNALALRQRTSARWVFFDTTGGCHNSVRRIAVAPDGRPSVQRTLFRAAREHEVTVLDARPGRLLYSDFNCRTNREAIKLAWVRSRIRTVAITGFSGRILVATLDYAGRKVVVGWNTPGSRVAVARYTVRNPHRIWFHHLDGLAYLWDLGAGTAGTVYAAAQQGLRGGTRVFPIHGTTVGIARVAVPDRFPGMAVSRGESIAMTDNGRSRAALKLSVSFGGPSHGRARVCGSAGVHDVTWLAARVLLAQCDYQTLSRYQLVDMRTSRTKTKWLGSIGTPGASGFSPVGLQ